MDQLSKAAYKWVYLFIFILYAFSFILGDPGTIPESMAKIVLANDILITDYISLVGISGAFFNVASVGLITAVLMRITKVPMDGKGLYMIGLMSGFSFFGKNIFNMWFILLGTWIYTIINKKHMRDCLIQSLTASALGPIISSTCFYNGTISLEGFAISLTCGIAIGYIMPMLSAHTNTLLHGLSLYNGGFAVGLLAMVIVAVLKSSGFEFSPGTHWATEYNGTFSVILYLAAAIFIAAGLMKDGKTAIINYRNILRRPGYASEDFIELDGAGAVLINMGVNCIIATSYILLIGGHLNGATIGGVFAIVGFSARGKHAKNIIPILLGVYLGGLTMIWPINSKSAQLAALFGTTLAPVSGAYGFAAGVFAGFIHSSVVLYAGTGYSGLNLYNNGFAGGITSIVMYPFLNTFFKANCFNEPSECMKKRTESAVTIEVEVPREYAEDVIEAIGTAIEEYDADEEAFLSGAECLCKEEGRPR